ncbi:MAG: HAMP domain-containing histidine kinase, partial [Clostridia bacterium]|nr:HAMP domain-containing histidine kinase [Clostridia bacterium]
MAYALIRPSGELITRTADFPWPDTGGTKSIPMEDGTILLVKGSEDDPEKETLRAQLEAALAANRAKERFLSAMSHDIRTPMNAIVGMTGVARKHMDERGRLLDALDKIDTASGHLLSLINDVLDMSRIDSGRMQLTRERYLLADLLYELLTMVRPLAEKKGHTLHVRTGEIAFEALCGDALRLRQVFVNILSNAVKYTPDGGRIDVQLSVTGHGEDAKLRFLCRDNGIGMSEDFLARIYEPFERVQSEQVNRIEGTGLGMSIVHRLITSMDGTIDIQSRLGEGTEVVIEVPQGAEEIRVDISPLRAKRSLLLEADAEAKARLQEIFTAFALDLTAVTSAQEGAAALSEAEFAGRPFDCAVIGNRVENSTGPVDIAAYLQRSQPALHLVLASEDD